VRFEDALIRPARSTGEHPTQAWGLCGLVIRNSRIGTTGHCSCHLQKTLLSQHSKWPGAPIGRQNATARASSPSGRLGHVTPRRPQQWALVFSIRRAKASITTCHRLPATLSRWGFFFPFDLKSFLTLRLNLAVFRAMFSSMYYVYLTMVFLDYDLSLSTETHNVGTFHSESSLLKILTADW
jgi:hypothetical protein